MHATPVSPAPLDASVEHARAAWRSVGQHLLAITPSHVARGILLAGAIGLIGWVTASAWSQLLPFQLGLVIAYITLPVVNWLDRFMPRWTAASVMVLLEVGTLAACLGLLAPPLFQELTQLVASLPDPDQVRAWLDTLRAGVQTLPPPVQDLLQNGASQLSVQVRTNALIYLQSALGVAIGTALGLFATLGFLIGFLGIPTWLVAVMSDQKAGVRAINRVMPEAMQPDFWAVVRILDRTFSAFVRGQFLLGLTTAILVYAGFGVLERLGITSNDLRLVLSAVAGVAQLIPAIGPLLGTLPAVAVAFAVSPSVGFATLAMYVAVQFIVNTFAAPLVADRYVDIHPAIFVIILVLLSQFGFIWLLVAAPVSVALRDLFRYTYGRFSDPPLPAGVAPGERSPAPGLQPVPRTREGVVSG